MNEAKKRCMKLFAALGPGDIVAAHRAQMSGQAILSEASIVFSGQLFEYCRQQGIEVLALSRNRRADSLRDGLLHMENQPRAWEGGSGARFHLCHIAYACYLATRARRFGADLAIIDSGSAHYFALALFRLVGIPVAVNLHNTLWPNGCEPKGRLTRLTMALDGWFFRRIAAAAVGVSPECGRQVQQLARHPLPFFEYRGQFRAQGFRHSDRPDSRRPFCVIFVGRAERNKGVLDLADMAERIRQRSTTPVQFEVCGDGGALPELRRIVETRGLGDVIRIHGRLARPELLEAYARAHTLIVPTRRDFCEGLPLVCAEAMLSGLPLITSRLSNAIPVLEPAIVEVAPEDIDGYAAAILRLAEDPPAYDRLASACPELAKQFLDRSFSYPAAIDRLIAHLIPDRKPLESYEPLFERLNA